MPGWRRDRAIGGQRGVVAKTWIVDPSRHVPVDELLRFNHYLSLIRHESGIDIRLLFDVPPQHTDLNAAAFSNLLTVVQGYRRFVHGDNRPLPAPVPKIR